MEGLVMTGFWHGRRVLITGHTGFKGAWLSVCLARLGAEVTGYSNQALGLGTVFEATGIAELIDDRRGDIRDPDALKSIFSQARPEVVFHLAAQPLVLNSYSDPAGTYDTNVMGTLHVLDAIRKSGTVRAAALITTDKCYQNNEWVWGYREADRLGGYDPYSSSKACAELLVASYRDSFLRSAGIAVATARAGNVIGGGDRGRHRLLPDLMASFAAGRDVTIRNPLAIRPWQHVLEPLFGYLQLAERLIVDGDRFADAWNFGPHGDDVRSVSWIVEQSAGLWGEGATWTVNSDSHAPHESTNLRLDIS